MQPFLVCMGCYHNLCPDRNLLILKMEIKVGDIYEDCAYHPVLCTLAEGDDLEGYSLLDGSFPRGCSIIHCGPFKLSPKHIAFKIKNRERWLEAERRFHSNPNNDLSPYETLLVEENEYVEKHHLYPDLNII